MHIIKMITGTFPIFALFASAPLASAADDYSFFVGYPDGYASYEAYVAGKTSATTSACATPAGSVEIATRSMRTQGTRLYSTKYRGLIIFVQ